MAADVSPASQAAATVWPECEPHSSSHTLVSAPRSSRAAITAATSRSPGEWQTKTSSINFYHRTNATWSRMPVPHGYNKVYCHAGLEPCQVAVGLPAAQIGGERAAGGVHRRDHGEVQPVLPHVSPRNAQAAQRRHAGRDLQPAGGRIRPERGTRDVDRVG